MKYYLFKAKCEGFCDIIFNQNKDNKQEKNYYGNKAYIL